MFDVATLADRLVEASGLDAIDLRLRVRYAKAFGLLPSAPRGTRRQVILPQVESLHAALVLAAAMVGGPQVRTPQAVQELWTSQKRSTQPRDDPALIFDSFGFRLLWFVERACRGDFLKSFELTVAQNRPYAAIKYRNQIEHFMPLGEPMHSRYRAPMTFVALAGPEVVRELAEVVMRSRAEATRLNVVIPWQEAWRALGYELPAEALRVPFLVSGYAPASADAETGRTGSLWLRTATATIARKHAAPG